MVCSLLDCGGSKLTFYGYAESVSVIKKDPRFGSFLVYENCLGYYAFCSFTRAVTNIY